MTKYEYKSKSDLDYGTVVSKKRAGSKKWVKNSYDYKIRKRKDGSQYTYGIKTNINGLETETIYSECCGLPLKIRRGKHVTTFTYKDGKGKICFAQTIPLERSPNNFVRKPSRLFVTFRKSEKIKDEVSVTSGHEYKASTVKATSGKNEFSMFSQGNFAGLIDREEEASLIKTMKKASRLSVVAKAKNGRQTKDLYSMMGFTKAYNAAKKNCA